MFYGVISRSDKKCTHVGNYYCQSDADAEVAKRMAKDKSINATDHNYLVYEWLPVFGVNRFSYNGVAVRGEFYAWLRKMDGDDHYTERECIFSTVQRSVYMWAHDYVL